MKPPLSTSFSTVTGEVVGAGPQQRALMADGDERLRRVGLDRLEHAGRGLGLAASAQLVGHGRPLRPVAEVLGHQLPRLVDGDVADDAEDDAVGVVVLRVPRDADRRA